MKMQTFKTFFLAIMTAFCLAGSSCNQSTNQGVDESGSADSNAQMNTDTLMIDTSSNGSSTDSSSVPVPTP
ncbi:hypothetical protein [Desertivirga xinjiangensis]|uniref:hypothetical protein n=1 Tax=Desertivirga xinjiangensis TaxID=539206 RepID=UPI00210D4870|nr:hypothetical protein [Pedobacter xinjiangensis]